MLACRGLSPSLAGSCFFKGRLRGRVALRVRGAGLLAGEAEPLEQRRETPDAVAHPIGPLDVLAQVPQAKGADAVPLGPGTAQDVSLEGGLLAATQPLGATRARLIVEALRSLGIEAQHRIAQRLALHPGEPGRLSPRYALERIGDGQQPQGRPAIPLACGAPTQVSGLIIRTDRKCGHDNAHRHRPRPSLNHTALERSARVTTSLTGYYPYL